jgi:hypothetical protein
MSKLTVEVGSKIPAFPAAVMALDHSQDDRTVVVALRVAPTEPAVKAAFENANLRTIRIGVKPDVDIKPGDDVLVPACTIIRVTNIPLKEGGTMVKLDANKKPVLTKTGETIDLLSATVKLDGQLQVNQAKVARDQIAWSVNPDSHKAAMANWA